MIRFHQKSLDCGSSRLETKLSLRLFNCPLKLSSLYSFLKGRNRLSKITKDYFTSRSYKDFEALALIKSANRSLIKWHKLKESTRAKQNKTKLRRSFQILSYFSTHSRELLLSPSLPLRLLRWLNTQWETLIADDSASPYSLVLSLGLLFTVIKHEILLTLSICFRSADNSFPRRRLTLSTWSRSWRKSLNSAMWPSTRARNMSRIRGKLRSLLITNYANDLCLFVTLPVPLPCPCGICSSIFSTIKTRTMRWES